MKVKFLDLKKGFDSNIIQKKILKVIDKCNFIGGKEVIEFEKNFSNYNGFKHFISCANGTDALELAVKVLDLEKNDEIIVQGNTYISTALSVVTNNHKIVLCDINKNTNAISIPDIEKNITSKTKALIVVHLYGLVVDMDKIMDLCKKYNLFLIEDCAQAHGAKWKDKCVGTFGDLSCYSFYPGKNLGAFGDGGGIGTNNDVYSEKLRKLKNIGCKVKYHHELLGRNSRLDTIQAVVLDEKLKFLNEKNNNRLENAKLYNSLLSNISQVKTPVINSNSVPVFHLYVIMIENRDELKEYLLKNGIECLIHYPISIAETDAFKQFNLKNIENCIENSKKILSLPMYPELQEDEIKYVCKKITGFYKDYKIYKKIVLDPIKTEGKPGELVNINLELINKKLNLNFKPNHSFYLSNLNSGKRGGHSNNEVNELLICLQGSFELKLIDKLNNENKILVNKNNCIYVPKNTWIELSNFNNCIVYVLIDNYNYESKDKNKCNSFEKFSSK